MATHVVGVAEAGGAVLQATKAPTEWTDELVDLLRFELQDAARRGIDPRQGDMQPVRGKRDRPPLHQQR